MMKFKIRIEICLREGHSDPEGNTTRISLVDLGYSVLRVKTMKIYEILLKAESYEEAEKQIENMCLRLLANPVKDDYSYEIDEEK